MGFPTWAMPMTIGKVMRARGSYYGTNVLLVFTATDALGPT